MVGGGLPWESDGDNVSAKPSAQQSASGRARFQRQQRRRSATNAKLTVRIAKEEAEEVEARAVEADRVVGVEGCRGRVRARTMSGGFPSRRCRSTKGRRARPRVPSDGLYSLDWA